MAPSDCTVTLVETLDAQTVKHLEFIQAVISRLANNAFLMKGWALTASSAFFGFSVRDVRWQLALLGLLPTLAFWGLDGYFLRRERQYRGLYDAVRLGDDRIPAFSMDYELAGVGTDGWIRSVISRTLWPFYLSITIVGLALVAATFAHVT